MRTKQQFSENCYEKKQKLLQVMTFALTALAMIAFAANSLLCRLALKETAIDAASFTFIRIFSGCLMLVLIAGIRGRSLQAIASGSWPAAVALFIYMAGFSFAYHDLTAATGALLLFGAVQITMIGYGISQGEYVKGIQFIGLFMALAGLVSLLLPGFDTPGFMGTALMLLAGVSWGVYSLIGRKSVKPLMATTGNFLRAIPVSAVLLVFAPPAQKLTSEGLYLAVASGALASGLGYAIWYGVLPRLKSSVAASTQLSVPILAALAGSVFLNETLTTELMASSVLTLVGIAIVINYAN